MVGVKIDFAAENALRLTLLRRMTAVGFGALARFRLGEYDGEQSQAAVSVGDSKSLAIVDGAV